MESPVKILILHGNFESELDWKRFCDLLESPSLKKEKIEIEFFNLWNFLKKNNSHSWSSFTEQFIKLYQKSSFDVALGYSLGGRILLNLLNAGWIVPKAIFLSTHTGLLSEEDRNSRIWNDLKWREKVLSSQWKILFEEWNSQDVFQGEEIPCFESFAALEIYRAEIAQAFDVLSLGRNQEFTQSLVNLSQKMELHWATGERDLKFYALAERLSQKAPHIHFKCFRGVGHRVHRSKDLSELLNLCCLS